MTTESAFPIQSVLIFYNAQKQKAENGAKEAEAFLKQAGIRSTIIPLKEENQQQYADINIQSIIESSDVILVFGGDGTILGVAREIVHTPRPIMGIHLGRFGFLTSSMLHELHNALTCLIEGKYQLVNRYLLEAKVERNSPAGEKKIIFQNHALNEALITLTRPGRLFDVWLGEEKEPALMYRGDGLIIATPTGSTGHSLSAGGPILEPSLAALVVTPLSPHSLFNRPLVFDGKKELCIWFRKDILNEPQLILDGQISQPLEPSDHVYIIRSKNTIQTISIGERTFTRVLRHKFNLGNDKSFEEGT